MLFYALHVQDVRVKGVEIKTFLFFGVFELEREGMQ